MFISEAEVSGFSKLWSWARMMGTSGAAVLLVWLTLRGLDILNDISFKRDILPQLLAGNLAVATYFGLRFAGVVGFYAYQLGRYF